MRTLAKFAKTRITHTSKSNALRELIVDQRSEASGHCE